MKGQRSLFFVLAALTLVASVLVSACASTPAPAAKQEPAVKQEQSGKTEPAAKQDQAAKKEPTGSLVVALSTLEAETFLPWNGGGGRTPYLSLINEYLVYTNPKTDELTPGLATKWEMSPDGRTWTFWIRQGVQFHEGWGELTAEDVKYSIEKLIAPDSQAGPASPLRKIIAKVEAPEPGKVVISLNNPYPELLRAYLTDANQAVIVSKKYVESVGPEKANSHPIGTGAYTLAEEHKKGGPIKLKTVEGVDKHWRVKPEFKNITFLAVPEEATRVAMLKNGEVDLAPISYDSIESVKASGLKIVSIPKNWAPVIRMGGLIEPDPKRFKADNPWANKKVRQALNYAIDRQAIVKNIFKGEASPAASPLPIPPFLDIEPYPYDPEKAKQLLAEAGYPKGFSVTLKTFTTNPGAELPTLGEAVALYWKAIGVDVKIVPTDWGTVRGEWTGGKAIDYVWTHRGMAFGDPLSGLDAEYKPDQAFASFATKESAALQEKLSSELDSKKREQLIREFAQLMRDEAAAVFLVFANEPYGASKKVGQWPTIRVRPQNIDMITQQ